MSIEELSGDVAKVLQGTHHVCIIDIPGSEYDLINRILADKKPLEDASPASVLVRRTFKVSPDKTIEFEMYNPSGYHEEPSIMISLFSHEIGKSESDPDSEVLIALHREHDKLPSEFEFDSKDTGGKTFLCRIRREGQ